MSNDQRSSSNVPFPIQKTLTTHKKTKPAVEDLGFGKHFTDHMLMASYQNGQWMAPQIKPYAPLSLDPAASVLHYGQALFEGMKAFVLFPEPQKEKEREALNNNQNLNKNDKSSASFPNTHNLALFRPQYNWQRFNQGSARLCMPPIPQDIFIEGIKELIRVDADWVPEAPNASLYIRPTLIGTEAFLGVRPSHEYLFFTILSPVGSYYGNVVSKGIKIWIEEEFVRAAPGGLGATKAAANYANSLFATQKAKEHSQFSQVLWLDVSHQFIEEVGTMNVFFVFKDRIVTPDLQGTILAGGVRDCVIQLLKNWKLPIETRPLSLKEVLQASQNNELVEIFGTGTAAVITSVEELHRKSGPPIVLPNDGMGPLAKKLFDTLTGIQRGTIIDSYQWLERI